MFYLCFHGNDNSVNEQHVLTYYWRASREMSDGNMITLTSGTAGLLCPYLAASSANEGVRMITDKHDDCISIRYLHIII